jgi:hypothetical protein
MKGEGGKGVGLRPLPGLPGTPGRPRNPPEPPDGPRTGEEQGDLCSYQGVF